MTTIITTVATTSSNNNENNTNSDNNNRKDNNNLYRKAEKVHRNNKNNNTNVKTKLRYDQLYNIRDVLLVGLMFISDVIVPSLFIVLLLCDKRNLPVVLITEIREERLKV